MIKMAGLSQALFFVAVFIFFLFFFFSYKTVSADYTTSHYETWFVIYISTINRVRSSYLYPLLANPMLC